MFVSELEETGWMKWGSYREKAEVKTVVITK